MEHDETTAMEPASAGAERARARQNSSPWVTINRLLSVLIAVFVFSSCVGTVGFYVIFHRVNALARSSYVIGCVRDNKTRAATLAGFDATYDRAKKAAHVAARAQKPTALKNLAALKRFVDIEDAALHQEDCSFPPPPIPATTTSTTQP